MKNLMILVCVGLVGCAPLSFKPSFPRDIPIKNPTLAFVYSNIFTDALMQELSKYDLKIIEKSAVENAKAKLGLSTSRMIEYERSLDFANAVGANLLVVTYVSGWPEKKNWIHYAYARLYDPGEQKSLINRPIASIASDLDALWGLPLRNGGPQSKVIPSLSQRYAATIAKFLGAKKIQRKNN